MLQQQTQIQQIQQQQQVPDVSDSGSGEETLEDAPKRPLKRRRDQSPTGSVCGPDVSIGESCINLKNGLEDDMASGDTVLDGMGALALGDEDDYGYFGELSRENNWDFSNCI